MQPVLCGVEGTASGGELERPILTGTVTGHIYMWKKERVEMTVTAHDAPIYSIACVRQGYITGGKDGLAKIWSDQLKLLHTYNTMLFFPQPSVNAIHSIKGNMVSSRQRRSRAIDTPRPFSGWRINRGQRRDLPVTPAKRALLLQ